MEKGKAYEILKAYVLNDDRLLLGVKGIRKFFPHKVELSEKLFKDLLNHKDVRIVKGEFTAYYMINVLGYEFFIHKSNCLRCNEKSAVWIELQNHHNLNEPINVYSEKK